jgi:hypothetical protein
MADVPDWVYEPVSYDARDEDSELSADLDLDHVPDGVRAGELTAGGDIPKGQRIRTRTWISYFAVKGTATVWLEDGDCTVYRILYDAFYETEISWLRTPPVVVERSSKWRSQWWRYLEVCPGGASWLPGEEWLYGDHAPPPVMPSAQAQAPDEYVRSRSAHSMRDDRGEFLLYRDLVLRRVSNGHRTGCVITAIYESVIRVSRFTIPNGPEVVIKVEHRDPPQFETIAYRIPDCVDDGAGSTSEDSR